MESINENNGSYSYTFAMKPSREQKAKLDRMFYACYCAYRDCVMYYRKRLDSYYTDRRYKAYISNRSDNALAYAVNQLGEAPTDEENKKIYDKKILALKDEWFKVNKISDDEKALLNGLQKEYDLVCGSFGSNSLRKKLLQQYREYIDDNMASSIVKNVASGVKKVLFSNGKTIKIKPFRDFNSICLTRNRDGYIIQDKGTLTFNLKQGRKKGKVRMLGVPIITKNLPAEMAYAVEFDKIRYGTIKRIITPSGHKYQMQILFAGTPRRTNLELKEGTVGVDVTERHVSIVAKDEVIYLETPCKSDKITETINNIQRLMDTQLRADNPEHFNEDGTFKKGVKGRFYKSPDYRKLRRKLSILYRKNNNYLEYHQNVLANYIASQGSVINIVQKDWKEKVRRQKETTFTDTGAYADKTSLSEESVRETAPAQLIGKIIQRSEYLGTVANKISNKNLEIYSIDIFTEKKMPYSEEDEFYIVNGTTIQRTMYYAYIMSGYDPETKSIDYNQLRDNWDNFIKLI